MHEKTGHVNRRCSYLERCWRGMLRPLLGFIVLLAAPHLAWGQVVQLPTFDFTTGRTTVVVPDGGSAFFGGIRNSSRGSHSLGVPGGMGPLFRNRAMGGSSGAANMSVHATIIDHAAWDEAVMSSASEALQASSMNQYRAARLSANIDRRSSTAASPIMSLEAIRNQNEAASAERLAEAENQFQQGLRAEAEGKKGAARIYYQIALQHAEGHLVNEIKQRLAAIQ